MGQNLTSASLGSPKVIEAQVFHYYINLTWVSQPPLSDVKSMKMDHRPQVGNLKTLNTTTNAV